MRVFDKLAWSVRQLGLSLRQVVTYSWVFFRGLLIPKAALAARLLAAESQLAVYTLRIHQKKDPHPRFTPAFRLLWVLLSVLWKQWAQAVHLMQPATVNRWHRTVFRFYWRWRSRKRPGRPPISQDLIGLIGKLSKENRLWSAQRIRDTLRLLGYEPPCEDTIRKYMGRAKGPRDRSTTWLPFLRNHLDVSWAIDFFIVVTANFSFLYVFLVFDHGRRKVVHWASSYSPSLDWVIQQLREATPFGKQPRYLFRDNDAIFGDGVKAFLQSSDIQEVRIA